MSTSVTAIIGMTITRAKWLGAEPSAERTTAWAAEAAAYTAAAAISAHAALAAINAWVWD